MTISVAASQALVSGTAMTLVERQVTPAAIITVTLAGTGASLAAAIATVVGQDANGAAQTEVVALATIGAHSTVTTFLTVTSITPSGIVFTGYTAGVAYIGTGPIAYNCACDDGNTNETLAELRTRLLIRLGYSAQQANPPPGMADLLDDFIVSAQKFLYRKYRTLRTGRFFSWVMTPGTRFYDIPANIEVCTKRLDALKVDGVWVEDLNNAWLPMFQGIPPEFYTSVAFQGIPSRYEMRQCIEVFPAPAEPYILRVKGHFGIETFTANTDQTTIDSELVFLWALANAKNHYGQTDAKDIASQANIYLLELVSGTHQTARYVPGAQAAIAVPAPVFIPLE